MYLEKINSPADIKSYSLDEMKALAQEMRDALLKKLSIHGGFGEKIARFYGSSDLKVLNFGLKKNFSTDTILPIFLHKTDSQRNKSLMIF